ncbi:S41 family peptidase [Bacillus sp. FJAT-45066]|uniref:S41 family peptidase n=1 Tax=Bacillus sp. FJAT-45066 TaxID=2011010 RepID=UPI000BB7EB9D|nr:S41 family peptidase [Bacillus sp. FJAT-45066]
MKNIGIVLLSFIMLIGCVNSVTIDSEAIEVLPKLKENNRHYIEHDFQDISHILYDYSNSKEEELSDEILQSLRVSNGRPPSNTFTKEQMIEDVETFHITVKYMYPLFEYMGGDESFHKAKTDLIQHIRNLNDNTKLDQYQFTALLRSHYDFILDGHFTINEAKMGDFHHALYLTDQYSFYQNEEMEFILTSDESVSLVAINDDQQLEKYLYPTLNDSGEIVFNPAIFSSPLSNAERDWKLNLIDNQGMKEVSVNLRQESKVLSHHLSGARFALTEKEGVPWLQIRSMMVYENDSYDYNDIIDTATKLKGKPYFVLDLRGNTGGSMYVMKYWMEDFFGKSIGIHAQHLHLFSKTSMIFLQDTLDKYKNSGVSHQLFEEDFSNIFRLQDIGELSEPHWEIEEKVFGKIDDNHTHIFILVDNNTASASEHLVAALKQANNTTVIGMNTMGTMISGDSLSWQLPNTKVEMLVPTFFNYSPDLINKEGIGIQPDIWVRPDRAEQRIINFILKNSK